MFNYMTMMGAKKIDGYIVACTHAKCYLNCAIKNRKEPVMQWGVAAVWWHLSKGAETSMWEKAWSIRGTQAKVA